MQPKRSFVENPAVVGQASERRPKALSPNPSLSWSAHWDGSAGKASWRLYHPSPSASGQPSIPLAVAFPGCVGQASCIIVSGWYSPGQDGLRLSQLALAQLSPSPSPSKSDHCVGSSANASAPSSTLNPRSGSECPSQSVSKHPSRSIVESPATSEKSSDSIPVGL